MINGFITDSEQGRTLRMADTDYIFHISPYDTKAFATQVSRALRTEMVSLERFPGLSKHTDRFRSMAQGRKGANYAQGEMSALCLAASISWLFPSDGARELSITRCLSARLPWSAGIGSLWQSRPLRKNPLIEQQRYCWRGKDKEFHGANPLPCHFLRGRMKTVYHRRRAA